MVTTRQMTQDMLKSGRTAVRAAQNGRDGTDLARDSAQVIARRLEIAAAGMADPRKADPVEMSRMVHEKTEAFSKAGQIAFARWTEIGARMTRAWAEETGALARASTNPSPEAWVGYAAGWFGRASHTAVALAELGQKSQAAVMAPVHRTAAANARRLKP